LRIILDYEGWKMGQGSIDMGQDRGKVKMFIWKEGRTLENEKK
jgi:hypothetical protein